MNFTLPWPKKQAVRKKGLGLIVHPEPKLPRINFDREKIRECLEILVDFAIRTSEKGNIVIRSFREKNTIRTSVQDSSAREPSVDLPHLFLRFEPISEAEKIKLGRTGLELVRVKEMIEKHRGKIWAEFLPDQGTVFHIVLPIWEKRFHEE